MILEKLENVKTYLTSLQTSLCESIEALETSGQTFLRDEWTRTEGGGGRSMVLEGQEIFERAGVNFSYVQGKNLPHSATAKRPQLAGRSFHATGVSIVIHPRNPYAPTSHANVRFFYAPAADETQEDIWWFGGGFDLTPYYGYRQDAIAWHQAAKAACDPFGEHLYPTFKAECDEYFFLKHRNEPRGIGGIFYDDFDEGGFENSFGLMQNVGNAYGPAYLDIVRKRMKKLYSDREKDFQEYRRGRYVEFNLVYDRGTHFGLQSNGRTESILVSMPPTVQWRYNYSPKTGTPEAELYETFLKPQDWAFQTPSPENDI